MKTPENVTPAPVGSGHLVRPVFLTRREYVTPNPETPFTDTVDSEVTGWHHGWTQTPMCAVGDGSSIYHRTLAIIELGDGRVEYAEPHLVRFLPNSAVQT